MKWGRGIETLQARVAVAAEKAVEQGYELIAECASCEQSASFDNHADRAEWSQSHAGHQLYHYIKEAIAA